MGVEGFNHEQKINPDKLPKPYEDVIAEDPDGNGYVLNTEAAESLDLITREDVASIIAELEKPDLDPKLRSIFEKLLHNKGVNPNEIL